MQASWGSTWKGTGKLATKWNNHGTARDTDYQEFSFCCHMLYLIHYRSPWLPRSTFYITHTRHITYVWVHPPKADDKPDKRLTPVVEPAFSLAPVLPRDTLCNLAPIKEHKEESTTQAGTRWVSPNLLTNWKTPSFTSKLLTDSCACMIWSKESLRIRGWYSLVQFKN